MASDHRTEQRTMIVSTAGGWRSAQIPIMLA